MGIEEQKKSYASNKSGMNSSIHEILSQKFKPYQVKHVEDQKQVVEGFVNSLKMQK